MKKLLMKAIPSQLRDPAQRYAVKAGQLSDNVKTASTAVRDSLSMRAQPRVLLLRTSPAASQVLANYTAGYLLLGRSPAFLAPLMWQAFPDRAIITKASGKVPRRVRDAQRRTDLVVKMDEDFEAIISSCTTGRDYRIWLTPELIEVYREVDKLGFMSTVGMYRDDELVAGLWGITVGRVFGIMSMFHRESGAGALAMAALVDVVAAEGRWSVIDCGLMAPHFDRFGAVEVTHDEWCQLVWQNLKW